MFRVAQQRQEVHPHIRQIGMEDRQDGRPYSMMSGSRWDLVMTGRSVTWHVVT